MPIRQRVESRFLQRGSPRWPGRSGASPAIWLIVICGLLATTLAVAWSIGRANASDADRLAEKGVALSFSAQSSLDAAAAQITAAGGLFRASVYVTPGEFGTFVDDIGLMTGVLGFGYVPIVADADLAAWLELTREEIPGFDIFELDDENQRTPVLPRELRFPLVYLEPQEHFSFMGGLDIGYHDQWGDELIARLGAEDVVATTFIELGLPDPLDARDQFVLGRPIADAETGMVSALVVAVVDLGMLLEANTAPDVLDGVLWEMVDVTDATDGAVAGALEAPWASGYVFGGREWEMRVAWEQPPSALLSTAALYPAAIGLTITLMLAAIGRLLSARLRTRGELATLESLSQGKDEFLAAVSHRLRTPLTSVVGFSEILREADGLMGDQDRQELVSTIAVQAIELGHLFDNLLTVSRDADRASFSPARVVLADEIAAVLDSAEPQRRAKITVVDAPPDVAAAGDPHLVRQTLRNLISNATDHGNTVHLRVVVEGLVARVLVRDDGPGVPASRLNEIFELYGHNDDDSGQPDTMGVGLFVSRRLARRMSGDLVHRRTAGWTEFDLMLPAMPAQVLRAGVVAESASAFE